jgi:hypothetical protein
LQLGTNYRQVLDPPNLLQVTTVFISKTYHPIMPNLQIPDNIPDSDRLRAMALVAKMKDAADKCGAQFIGGFIAPDGTKYIASNMDEDDPNYIIPDNLQ